MVPFVSFDWCECNANRVTHAWLVPRCPLLILGWFLLLRFLLLFLKKWLGFLCNIPDSISSAFFEEACKCGLIIKNLIVV